MSEAHPLKLAYAREYPAEVARYLAMQGGDAVSRGLEDLPAETAASVVARLPYGHAARELDAQGDEVLVAWLDAASLDHALGILLQLEEERRKRLLARLPSRSTRRKLERLVVYPRETIGALVNPAAVRLSADASLKEGIALLRSDQPGPEQSTWVVDTEGRYCGLLDINGALVARSDSLKLGECLISVSALRAETALETARDFSAWLAHSELPVVDHRNYLLGTVSRRRLETALKGDGRVNGGMADWMSDLTRLYYRFLQASLGELFSPRRSGR